MGFVISRLAKRYIGQKTRNKLKPAVESLDSYWHNAKSLLPMDRLQPNFCIIGAQKSGTTSLYDSLCSHPKVLAASKKEIHYYDTLSSPLSKPWYQAHFPRLPVDKGFITGEATPAYLFHPQVAPRMASDSPKLKLLVLLRDPVERAISHYFHNRRLGLENLSLPAALEAERDLATSYCGVIDSGPKLPEIMCRSYSLRGLYASQLQYWLRFFNRDQFFIETSENFFKNPSAVLSKAGSFIGVDFSSEGIVNNKLNSGIYSEPVEAHCREYLQSIYQEENKKLASEFEVDISGWV